MAIVAGIAFFEMSAKASAGDQSDVPDEDTRHEDDAFFAALNEIEAQEAASNAALPDADELAEISANLHVESLAHLGSDVPQFDDLDVHFEDLALIWDDGAEDEPEAYLVPSNDNPDLLELRLNNRVMARVPVSTGITPGNIVLVPQSAAEAMGWLDADGPESDAA